MKYNSKTNAVNPPPSIRGGVFPLLPCTLPGSCHVSLAPMTADTSGQESLSE